MMTTTIHMLTDHRLERTFGISASTLFQRLVLNALRIMLNVLSIGPSTPFLGKLVELLLMKSLYN